jgi:hypothetical protein
MGVMNGTCNYILTRMESAGLPYDTVFEEARQLGYLEADPNLDVDGIDAGHKLSILSAIAFGTQVDFDAVQMEGIGAVSIDDIRLARDMGYAIKLLGVAQMTGRGLEQRMTPCLVPETHPLGQLQGGTNMVVIEGDAVGQIVLRGAGAGEGPTASAVMGDVIDIARGLRLPTFGQPAASLQAAPPAAVSAAAPWYLRMTLARQTRRAGADRDGAGRRGHLDRPDAAIRPRGRACAGADRHPQGVERRHPPRARPLRRNRRAGGRAGRAAHRGRLTRRQQRQTPPAAASRREQIHRQPPAEGLDIDHRQQHPGQRQPHRQRQRPGQRRQHHRARPRSSAASLRRVSPSAQTGASCGSASPTSVSRLISIAKPATPSVSTLSAPSSR